MSLTDIAGVVQLIRDEEWPGPSGVMAADDVTGGRAGARQALNTVGRGRASVVEDAPLCQGSWKRRVTWSRQRSMQRWKSLCRLVEVRGSLIDGLWAFPLLLA